MSELHTKPLWVDAPDWANALGICEIESYNYYKEWCRLNGTAPEGFSNIEQRPVMKSYLVTVKFHALINNMPVLQSLNVCTTEPEFSVLLQALNASADVAELQVFSKHLTSTNHPLTKMTHEDLGYINNVNMEKLV